MAKELAIFDLYNTLIVDNFIEERHRYCLDAIWSALEKSGHPIRFKEVIEAYNMATEIVLENQKNHHSIGIFDQVRMFAEKIKLTDIVNIKKIYDIWSFAALQISPELLPFVKNGLHELKDHGIKTALISNTACTPGIALRMLLHDFGVYCCFDDLVFSDEFGLMKPKRIIFDRVLEMFNMNPEQAVFVGDHEYFDKFGSENAGIDYILMNPEKDFQDVVQKILAF